jgi:hypothetical protein
VSPVAAQGLLIGASLLALGISTYPEGSDRYKIGWRIVSGLFALPVFIAATRAVFA